MSQNKVYDTPFNQMLAGSFAGLISDGVVHPLDTVRARLQTQSANNKMYTSSIQAIREIIKFEGPRAFYKGFGVVALSTFPAHGLYFYAYENTKRIFGKENEAVWLISGLAADVAGAIVWTPMDIIKQRIQILRNDPNVLENRTTSWTIAKEIWKTDGLRGMFRGFGAGIATFGPYVMIYFALYERMKIITATKYYADGRTALELPLYTCLALAATAGGISSFVTCPFDVVKTRMQTKTVQHYSNLLHGVRTIYKNEGIHTFFQGAGPRVLWIGGGTAITMMIYEYLKQFLRPSKNFEQY